MICSSEGRLFEYASDNEIQSNLEVLREFPEVLAVVGSVTRADEPIQRIRQMGRAATRPRGLEVFRTLILKKPVGKSPVQLNAPSVTKWFSRELIGTGTRIMWRRHLAGCCEGPSPRRVRRPARDGRATSSYAVAPNRTDTSFETPGSCIVTP